MEVRNWVSSIKKHYEQPITDKKLFKAKRLHKAQLATFKKGIFTTYKPTFLKNRRTLAAEEMILQSN